MIDISFFCSPIGLGHATRDYAITEYFENISTKFITGNGAATFLQEFGFDVNDVYNPPQFIVKNGLLKSSTKWLWSYYQYYKNCKNIATKLLDSDKPKLVVSDEDFASLTVAQNKKIPSVVITDILQTHFAKGLTSLIEKKMNKSMQEIIKKCDFVILPEIGLDEGNIRRVGPIVRQTTVSREELRRKFDFDKKTIVISVGGTDAGKFLIEKTLQDMPKNQDIDVVVVSGPSLDKKYDNVRNFGFVNNLHEIIFAADTLVSLAGKSTIDEAKAYGTPAIFIPIKGHFEQEDNAREEGFVFEDVNRLESLILEKISQKKDPIKADGASKACKIIQSLL